VRGHKVTADLFGPPQGSVSNNAGWRAKQSAVLTIVKVRRRTSLLSEASFLNLALQPSNKPGAMTRHHHLRLLLLPFVFTRWFTATALLAGWTVGFFGGSYLAWIDGLKPLHPVTFGETTFTVFVGMIAFAANAVCAVLVNLAVPKAVAK
jgi:hypothetical protein